MPSGVLVVTHVSVSSPSVGVLGEVSPSDSDCETVQPQSFSFSRKCQAFHMESQGDVNAVISPEDVQPLSRRRTPDVDCGVDQRWAAVYQSIARRMLSCLDNSEARKVDTKELDLHQVNRESTMTIQRGKREEHKVNDCSRSSADKEQNRSWLPVWQDGRSI